METYIIYKITSLVDNRIYVGKHKQINDCDSYLGSGKLIDLYIKKYGKECLKKEIIEYVTSANINEKEIYWIKELSAYNYEYPNIGLNLTKGGDGVIFWNDTQRKNKSQQMKNVKFTDEWLKNKSLAMIGNKNSMYGKKHSDKTK
jgi:hypothetical protein